MYTAISVIAFIFVVGLFLWVVLKASKNADEQWEDTRDEEQPWLD